MAARCAMRVTLQNLIALKRTFGSLNTALVAIYDEVHPMRSVAEAARDLGLSRDTVRRCRLEVAKIATLQKK